jgi:hypothetical protein
MSVKGVLMEISCALTNIREMKSIIKILTVYSPLYDIGKMNIGNNEGMPQTEMAKRKFNVCDGYCKYLHQLGQLCFSINDVLGLK